MSRSLISNEKKKLWHFIRQCEQPKHALCKKQHRADHYIHWVSGESVAISIDVVSACHDDFDRWTSGKHNTKELGCVTTYILILNFSILPAILPE